MGCKHKTVQWNLASCNEDGWLCTEECGKKLGFRPDLDRKHTSEKVEAISLLLHINEFIYHSNATAGDIVASEVTKRCKKEDRYDQASIIQFILDLEQPSHYEFWQKQAHEELTNVRTQVRRLRSERQIETPLFPTEVKPEPDDFLDQLKA